MELAAHLLSYPPITTHKHHQLTSLPASHCTLRFPKSNVQDPWKKQLQPSGWWSNKLKVQGSQVEAEEEEEESCELVNGSELTIAMDGDEEGIQAYLFKAVKNNNATGILLLSDTFGFQDDATRDFAYRVACGGYNVLVPDLFDGNPQTSGKVEQRGKEIKEAILASARWLLNEFEMVGISKKLGIISFGYGGGPMVDILAEDEGAYFGCGVCFYGTKIDTIKADKVKVPLLMITGENDEQCPVRVVEEMSKRNTEVKTVVFPGRGHGFAHRPQNVDDDGDAEKAFVVMRDWLAQGLLAQFTPATLT